ncbi:hypothetical protein WN51_05981 [Melipona quadrifasciata]|uniref:Uncharacterized protein n=1 Tax=Melipona quadrifasciata TaxID=166423 RepID=A0A0N0BIS2_9HYME|nr:hypothetical protein WN51_05981 [Melipona quadrifasciata]
MPPVSSMKRHYTPCVITKLGIPSFRGGRWACYVAKVESDLCKSTLCERPPRNPNSAGMNRT